MPHWCTPSDYESHLDAQRKLLQSNLENISSIKWKICYQGKTIQQNSSAGIIMSNQSLVLQQIDRNTAGIYTCQATNLEGQGTSNDLSIPVKCKFFLLLFSYNQIYLIITWQWHFFFFFWRIVHDFVLFRKEILSWYLKSIVYHW